MSFKPSPEQQAIFDHCTACAPGAPGANLVIEAVAGSGKTTTLLQLLAQALQARGGTILAFNKKIAGELQARIASLGGFTSVAWSASTVHAAGFSAFRKAGAKPKVEGSKVRFLLEQLMGKPRFGTPEHTAAKLIAQLVSFAKSSGFGISSAGETFPALDDEGAWLSLADHFGIDVELADCSFSLTRAVRYAQAALGKSNASTALVDFDDMVYLPLLLNLPLQQHSNVLLDEAQDTNATRRELAFRMLRPNGRLIAVGDRHQAIYGFTGADAEALSNISRRAAATELPLSVSWRCPVAVVREAPRDVSHIQAAPSAPEGQVLYFEWTGGPAHGCEREDWLVNGMAMGDFLSQPLLGDAILCRLNRPNVAVAIGLLRRGTPARIEGRDLGKKLLSHARKAAEGNTSLDLAELLHAIDEFERYETNLLLGKGKEASAAYLADELDALRILIERCLELGKHSWMDLDRLCDELFGDDVSHATCVTLSSIHKSKGLEFPRVWLLGASDYQPFFKATQPWELEQETNLLYVAITRSQRELIHVSGVASALDRGLHRAAEREIPR